MWTGGQCHAPCRFTPAKESVSIEQEARWVTGPVWTGAGNRAPQGFDPSTVKQVVVT